jgi:hypothetical protein
LLVRKSQIISEVDQRIARGKKKKPAGEFSHRLLAQIIPG